MDCFSCPRCGFEGLERKFSVCAGCNYGLETDPEADVPIPSWVLQFIELTPQELEEIKEINFGPSLCGRIPASKKSLDVDAPKAPSVDSKLKRQPAVPPPRSNPLRERYHITSMPVTGQCVA